MPPSRLPPPRLPPKLPPPRIAIFAEQGHFTAVHNLTLRVVMPQLSGSAWKVLCFLISETVGYGRRSELISYSAIKTGTGIKSSTTIARALTELLEGAAFGCPLVVREVGAKRGAAAHEFGKYGLNLKFAVDLPSRRPSVHPASHSSKNGPRPCPDAPENGPRRSPENGPPISAPIGNAGELIEERNESFSHALSEDGLSEDGLSEDGLSEDAFSEDGMRESEDGKSPHFLALCAVCQLDPNLLSARKLGNAQWRASQLSTKYTPEQIVVAGERWPLPVAPHPDQLLDSIQALLARKTPHDASNRDASNRDVSDREIFNRDVSDRDDDPNRHDLNAPTRSKPAAHQSTRTQPVRGDQLGNDKLRNDRLRNEHQRNADERRQLMGELARRFR